jgi:hypothetical protein
VGVFEVQTWEDEKEAGRRFAFISKVRLPFGSGVSWWELPSLGWANLAVAVGSEFMEVKAASEKWLLGDPAGDLARKESLDPLERLHGFNYGRYEVRD